MTTIKMRFLPLLAIGAITVFLVCGRKPATQATSLTYSPASSTYEYKVELVKHNTDLEGVLQANARNGWRVREVVIGPYHNELVVVLEKGGNAP